MQSHRHPASAPVRLSSHPRDLSSANQKLWLIGNAQQSFNVRPASTDFQRPKPADDSLQEEAQVNAKRLFRTLELLFAPSVPDKSTVDAHGNSNTHSQFLHRIHEELSRPARSVLPRTPQRPSSAKMGECKKVQTPLPSNDTKEAVDSNTGRKVGKASGDALNEPKQDDLSDISDFIRNIMAAAPKMAVLTTKRKAYTAKQTRGNPKFSGGIPIHNPRLQSPRKSMVAFAMPHGNTARESVARIVERPTTTDATFRRNVLSPSPQLRGGLDKASKEFSSSFEYSTLSQYQKFDATELLRKNKYERTARENMKIYQSIRHLKAFKKLTSSVLTELCGVLEWMEYQKEKVVFRQGDVGTSWYVIFRGSVDVFVSQSGDMLLSRKVNQLYTGEGFGDLALVNDKPRAATIIAAEKTVLIKVDRADYMRMIRFAHQKEEKEKILFLKKISIFKDWTVIALKGTAEHIKWQKYPKNAIIVREGEVCPHVLFIRTGVCDVYKTLHPNHDGDNPSLLHKQSEQEKPTTSIPVKIGVAGPTACFGQESVVYDDVKMGSPITLRTSTACTVAVMLRYEAVTKFRSEFSSSAIQVWIDWDQIRLYKEWKRQRDEGIWKRIKMNEMRMLERTQRKKGGIL